jgi:hypothetical protein
MDRMKIEHSREYHIAQAKEQLASLEHEARELAKLIREDKFGLISQEMYKWVCFSSRQLRVNPFEHYLELVLQYRFPGSSAMPFGYSPKVVETPNAIVCLINDFIRCRSRPCRAGLEK